jgi:hypothetical protein
MPDSVPSCDLLDAATSGMSLLKSRCAVSTCARSSLNTAAEASGRTVCGTADHVAAADLREQSERVQMELVLPRIAPARLEHHRHSDAYFAFITPAPGPITRRLPSRCARPNHVPGVAAASLLSASTASHARYREGRYLFTPADPLLVGLNTRPHWLWHRKGPAAQMQSTAEKRSLRMSPACARASAPSLASAVRFTRANA